MSIIFKRYEILLALNSGLLSSSYGLFTDCAHKFCGVEFELYTTVNVVFSPVMTEIRKSYSE